MQEISEEDEKELQNLADYLVEWFKKENKTKQNI